MANTEKKFDGMYDLTDRESWETVDELTEEDIWGIEDKESSDGKSKQANGKKWSDVDKLAEEFFALKREGNEGAWQSKALELFSLVMELSYHKYDDALGELWLEVDKFDSSKGKFSKFVLSRLNYRSKDIRDKDFGVQTKDEVDEATDERKKKKKYPVSLNAPQAKEEADGTPLEDRLEGNLPTVYEKMLNEDALLEAVTLMLNLPARLQGKANNPIKANYYRMFFTDGISGYIRSEFDLPEIKRERDLFDAFKLPFLDYYMAKKCRTVSELRYCNLKPYGEVVSGRTVKDELEQPLPNDVYIAYLKAVEQYSATAPALSMQRKEYQSFMREYLC